MDVVGLAGVPISETASPQRMGAALTYARRYALFTLVGIAGDDDLDAPDLGAAPKPAAELPRPGSQSNGQAAAGKRTAPGDGKLPEPSARSVLGVQLSASLRESLIEQMAAINSADEAAAWAHRNLPAKNTLTAADAQIVEERFQARLSSFGDGLGTSEPSNAVPVQSMAPAGRTDASAGQKIPAETDKPPHKGAVRALSKTVRLRDKEHQKPCSATGFRTSTRTSFRATPTTRARAGPSRSRSRTRGRCRRDASRGTWQRCVRHWRSDRCVDRC